MSNVKISQLPVVSSVTNSDVLPVVASNTTSQLSIQNLADSLPQVPSSVSASYAVTASYAANVPSTASYALQAETASYVENAQTASFVTVAQTASYVETAQTASYVVSSSYAISASYADFADIAGTANSVPLVAGPGITINGLEITASVRSVNGVFPANGNIATSLTATVTGVSASLVASGSGNITASIANGTVWVISGDPTPANNGDVYIYLSGSVGQWLPIAPLDTAAGDARYLMLNPQSALVGNLDLGTNDILNIGKAVGGEFSGSFSGSFQGDGSGLTGVVVPAFPFIGNAQITGSLSVAGGVLRLRESDTDFAGGFLVNPADDYLAFGQRNQSNEFFLALSGSTGFFPRPLKTRLYSTKGFEFVVNAGQSIQMTGSVGIQGALNVDGTGSAISFQGNNIMTAPFIFGQGYMGGASTFPDPQNGPVYPAFPMLWGGNTNVGSGGASGYTFVYEDKNIGHVVPLPNYNVPAGAIKFVRDAMNTSIGGANPAGTARIPYFTVITNNASVAENSLSWGFVAANGRNHVLTVTGSILSKDGVSLGTSLSNIHYISGSVRIAGSATGSFSGSFRGDGSGLTGISATAFPYVGTARITGSLIVSGSTTEILGGLIAGTTSQALGEYAAVLNQNNSATGNSSLAHGNGTTAFGTNSHAEGLNTYAGGSGAHTEGNGTFAVGSYSHAEGNTAGASGIYSHAEGDSTSANGQASHAEGYATNANGDYSHAEGRGAITVGDYSHAEGYNTVAFGTYSHAQGEGTIASGSAQLAAGKYNRRGNTTSLFVIGNGTGDLNANRSDILRVEQTSVQVSGSLLMSGSIIPNVAAGNFTSSFSLGSSTAAWKDIYVANGTIYFLDGAGQQQGTLSTTATGLQLGNSRISGSLAQGDTSTSALGNSSHAEGYYTNANADYSHAEGFSTTTSGNYSHAEGFLTSTSASYAHAEGMLTKALGVASHAQGSGSIAYGHASFAGGFYTIASGSAQTALGKHNLHGNTTSLFVIGNGTDTTSRGDILRVETDSIQISGSLLMSGSIIPSTGATATSSFSLGSPTAAWKDLYVSNGTIYFLDGAGQQQGTLSTTANGLQLTGDIFVATDGYTGIRLGEGEGDPASKAFNTALGYSTLGGNISGSECTAVGYAALNSNTNGDNNTAVGAQALTFNTTGNRNIAIGRLAMHLNQIGNNNVVVGTDSMTQNVSGSANVVVGNEALANIVNGTYNTVIGYSAGAYVDANSSGNVYIGGAAGPGSLTTENNKLYINYGPGTPLIGGDFVQRQVILNGDLVVTGSVSYATSVLVEQGHVVLTQVSQSLNFADDAAAQAGGVPLGGLYRNGNIICIRIS